jgi:hypothetical protein
MIEEIKRKWEDWYGDMVTSYQWNELEYNGRKVLYVCGQAMIDSDGRGLCADLLQVLGYVDEETALNEVEQKEIADMLRSMHGVQNISFWIE